MAVPAKRGHGEEEDHEEVARRATRRRLGAERMSMQHAEMLQAAVAEDSEGEESMGSEPSSLGDLYPNVDEETFSKANAAFSEFQEEVDKEEALLQKKAVVLADLEDVILSANAGKEVPTTLEAMRQAIPVAFVSEAAVQKLERIQTRLENEGEEAAGQRHVFEEELSKVVKSPANIAFEDLLALTVPFFDDEQHAFLLDKDKLSDTKKLLQCFGTKWQGVLSRSDTDLKIDPRTRKAVLRLLTDAKIKLEATGVSGLHFE